MADEEITLEQAHAALQQVNTGASDDSEVADESTGILQETEQPEVETVAAAAETEEVAGTEEAAPAVEDEQPAAVEAQPDTELEDTKKLFQDRMDAQKERFDQNQGILRTRLLQKSTATDSALKLLQATLTEDGVGRDDVQKVIAELKGTMNPASPSYAPPPETLPRQETAVEDQNMVMNDFLNEKSLTAQEAQDFGNWVRTEAQQVMSQAEQNVAQHSVDGFLRLAHGHWSAGVSAQEKAGRTNDAVGAVKSVQRTQRAAARAASSKPAAPIRQPASPQTTVDVSKFTEDDVSRLLQQTVRDNY